jgi:sec-independent protein translocase protein TatC
MSAAAGRRQPEHENAHARESEREHDGHGGRRRTGPRGAGREDDEGKMGFLEHLDELRTRLIRACLAIGAGMLVAFALSAKLGEIVMSSLLASLPADAVLISIKPGEGFAFYLDLSLMGGVVLAAPVIAWQVWRFVAPGLYVNERRLVVPFVLLAVAGSIAGAAFSHFVLFPSMMAFFRTFESPQMRFMPRVEDTFALYKNTMMGMVLVFQIPTLIYVLARVGLVTPRGLWRHLKHAVLGAVIAAAVLTPSSDPWNQLVFAAPIVAMYVIGIAIAWLVKPRPRRGSEAEADDRSAMGLVIAAAAFEQARRRRADRN